MSPSPGTRIGPYEVIAQIGEGGMGQVYRATDTNLKRTVAIKLLPEAVATDVERLTRFQWEAEALARLNHPNIAQIHGLERTDGTIALVMELVEGETLALRIARGPIPLEEALPIARQIAEALEAAHEQGIIHRDLKPSNIKVRADGAVKVLDFGLAKTLEPIATDVAATAVTSPAMTQAGVILGTAAYMSPEQARGRPVDKRADVWAFGCVLYEMLAGVRAFPGGDVTDTLAGILRDEPKWELVPPQTPSTLLLYLKRCLHKDPRQRVHDVADIRLALDGAFETIPTPLADRSDNARTSGRRGWSYAVTGIVGIVVGSVLTGLLVWSLTRPVVDEPARFAISLRSTGWQENPNGPALVAFSPNGRTIVYAARNGLYRRDLGRLALELLPGTEAVLDNINTPFFSPDGQWIGYRQAGAIKKVALSGGSPITILQAVPRGASWGAEDAIVFGSNTGLFRVSANGGQPEAITTLTKGEVGHHRPEVLPGGEGVIFTVWRGSTETAQVAVVSLRTGERRTLVSGAYPRYTSSGHIVFAREDSLWAVPFNPDRLEVSGTAVQVLDGVRIEAASGVAQFAVAANGSLLYATATSATRAQRLVWVDRQGQEEALGIAAGPYSDQRISPDGTRVAMTIASPDNVDVWVLNLARGNLMRLTFDEGPDRAPLWTRDSARVVFHSGVREAGLFWKAADGSGQVERLLDNSDRPVPQGWSRDGQLVFNTTAPGARDIGLVPVKGGHPARMIIDTPHNESNATVSPDGQWLAYHSDESGRTEVYVRRLPDVTSGKWQVSLGGGTLPLWSPDGRELFYRTAESLMVAGLQTGPAFSTAAPKAIFAIQKYFFPLLARSYDVSPDGRRFLMLKPEAGAADNAVAPDLIFVENWTEELKRRVPTQ